MQQWFAAFKTRRYGFADCSERLTVMVTNYVSKPCLLHHVMLHSTYTVSDCNNIEGSALGVSEF